MTVECNPLGPQLMKAIKDYAAGKDLPVRIITAEEVFPAEVAPGAVPGALAPVGPGPEEPKSAQNSRSS